MDQFDDQSKASIYAEMAHELILSGVSQLQSEEDQRLLLRSLLCQCALLVRMVGGEQAFQYLLDELRSSKLEPEPPADSMLH